MKIENKSVLPRNMDSAGFHEFVTMLGKLNPGQSFVAKALPAHYRTAISTAQILLGRKFATAKEGSGFRVGSVESPSASK